MDVIYKLIPFVLLFGFLAVLIFIWMAKKGQFDDLDRAAHQIFLLDDEDAPASGSRTSAHEANSAPHKKTASDVEAADTTRSKQAD